MAELIVREPGQVTVATPLRDGLTVGRGEDNAVVLSDRKTSRRHACFHVSPLGAVSVEDLGSTHGLTVNGVRAASPAPQALRDGDRIQIGDTLITLVEGELGAEIVHRCATIDLAAPGKDAPVKDARRLRIFSDLGRAIGGAAEPDELLRRMLASILDALGGEVAVAGLGSSPAGPGAPVRRLVVARPPRAEDDVVVSRALVDAVLTQREGVLVGPKARTETLVRQRVLSAIAAPILSGPEVLGFFYVDDRAHPDRFGVADLEFLVALGHLAGAAVRGAERYQRAVAAAEALGAFAPAVELTGTSPPMERLKAQIRKYGASTASVLVRGESGTGKELVARTLHAASPRAERPFVAVNCAAIPEALIESELFGHTRGAFTGALKARRGRFTLADGGTIFLDEIGDLSLPAQAKVLRALQEGEVQPVGAEASTTVDVRVIAATHKDLREEIAARRFREDLYYRLKVVELEVPPLRARAADIGLLAHALLAAAAARLGKRLDGFSPEALAALARHRWPGNVRELSNEVERAAIATEEPLIDVHELSPELVVRASAPASSANAGGTLAERFATIEPLERQLVEEALAAAQGNVSEAARMLGITRIMMKRRMDRFGLGEG